MQNLPERAFIPAPDALSAAKGYPALSRPSGSLEILCNPDFAFLEVTALDSEGRAGGEKWPSWSCGKNTHAAILVPSPKPPSKVVVVAVPGLLSSPSTWRCTSDRCAVVSPSLSALLPRPQCQTAFQNLFSESVSAAGQFLGQPNSNCVAQSLAWPRTDSNTIIIISIFFFFIFISFMYGLSRS